MNKIFKVVKNRQTGHVVVASEFAKGIKKGQALGLLPLMMLISCGVGALPLSDDLRRDTFLSLQSEYLSAEYDANTSTWLMHANEKMDVQTVSEGNHYELQLNPNTVEFIENLDYHDPGLTLAELLDSYPLSVKITQFKDGNEVQREDDIKLSTYADWFIPNNPSVMEEITWEKEDGEPAVLQVYNTAKFKKEITPDLDVYLLTQQPVSAPFYQLTLVEVNDGTLTMTGANSIDWTIQHIKESSLFVANADTEKTATITTSSQLNVTFGEAYSMDLSTGNREYLLQPKNKLVDSVRIPKELDNFIGEDGKVYKKGSVFPIADEKGLQAYNSLLIKAITENVLPGAKYRELIEATVIESPQDENYYKVSISLKGQEHNEIVLNQAIKKSIGKRAIFEAYGKGSGLYINDGAAIRAETNLDSGRYRAYHIYAHDGAEVFHNATTLVPNYKGQNALINNATFTNSGILQLGDGKTRIHGDEVTGKAGKYINVGQIVVEAFNLKNNDPTDSEVISNTGITARNKATVINEKQGSILLGQKGIGEKQGTVTGIQLSGASFINHGLIELGKPDVSLLGGMRDDTYDMRAMSNAIAAKFDNTMATGEINEITNNGTIIINEGVKNAVAINVDVMPSRDLTTQLLVSNVGEIHVSGTNTVGMRISGTSAESDRFENQGTIVVAGEGSLGLFALGNSKVTHSGQISVSNSTVAVGDQKPVRSSGIRADDAHVIIDGGSVELKGNNTVGVFARIGGSIDLKNSRVIFDENAVNQIGYWISGLKGKGTNAQDSSSINFGAENVTLTLNNNHSTLFRVDQKASFMCNSSSRDGSHPLYTFNINGEQSNGLYIADKGTKLKTDNMVLNVAGNHSTGLYLASGAGADNNVVLDKSTQISVSGENATIAIIDGNYYDIHGNYYESIQDKALLTSQAHLISNGSDGNIAKNAIGYKLINGGGLNHAGIIDFRQAENATGILIKNGTLNNQLNSDISVNGVGVDIYGKTSLINNRGAITATNGIAAIRLNQDSIMKISKSGVIKGENSADAVRIYERTKLELDKARIDVTGSGSGLHFIGIDDGKYDVFRVLGSGTVTVSGDNASGLTLEGDDGFGGGGMAKSGINTTEANNVTINVEDKGGNGIVTNTMGNIINGMNVNIKSLEGQAALVVRGESKKITQRGHLISNSVNSVVDLTGLHNRFSFINDNQGKIISNAHEGVAILMPSNENNYLENKGTIQGRVILGNGDNTVKLYGGSSLTHGAIGTGRNLVTLFNVKQEQSEQLFGQLSAGDGKSDTLQLDSNTISGHYLLQDNRKINGFEKLAIEKGRFELRNTDIILNESTKADGIFVGKLGELFINQTENFQFTHQLSGAGLVVTQTKGNAFSFTQPSSDFTGDAFTGTLHLTQGTFDLAKANTSALKNALLKVGKDAIATVRKNVGTQSFDRLTLSGGTLAFNENITGRNAIDSAISVNSLQLDNAKGTIRVNAEGYDNLPVPTIANHISLLEQDEGKTIVQLAQAKRASEYTGGLTLELVNNDGSAIRSTTKVEQALSQKGKVVAQGTYDYGLQTQAHARVPSDGLYVAYRLTDVELLGKNADALVLSAAAGEKGAAVNLGAKLTGQGDLAINTASDYVSLSNNRNDYTGSTFVRHGTLRAQADHVFGNTQQLDLAEGTSVELTSSAGNATAQTVGKVTSAINSLIALGRGKLTVKAGGTIKGALSGTQDSELYFQGNEVNITGVNPHLSASITIDKPAQVFIDHIQGLGQGAIAINGQLHMQEVQGQQVNPLSGKGMMQMSQDSDVELSANNREFSGRFITDNGSTLRFSQADHIGDATIENAGTVVLTAINDQQPWTLTQALTGTGTLVKQGIGHLILGDKAAQYTGTTEIQQGIVQVGHYDASQVMHSRQINIGSQGTFAGQGQLKGNVRNAGQFYVGEVDKRTLAHATQYRVNGHFINDGGHIWLASEQATESRLFVDGDFTANGGVITLNTILNKGHEETMTDQLIVGGNVNTGKQGATLLDIRTVGGNGEGISEQPDAIKVVSVAGKSSHDAFELKTPVTIGIYEYLLHKGENDDSWYLDSYDTDSHPPDDKDGNGNLGNVDEPETHFISPVIGGYLANQATAIGMFSMTLHDRLGEPRYADSFIGSNNASSVWLRMTGDRKRHDAANRSLRLKGNTYSTQLGADIISWNSIPDTSIRAGVMGAIGKSDGSSRSKETGSKADAKIEHAYSVGIYGTWYQNRENKHNGYVDVWAQYAWFDNSVSMSGVGGNYDSHLFSASLEAGYHIGLYQPNKDRQWRITPQFQAIFNTYKLDDSEHASGLSVQGERNNSVTTRLGARLSYANQIATNKSAQPFIEVNWRHESAKNKLNFNSRYHFNDDTPANRVEIKAGVEGQLSANWTIWGHIAHDLGAKDYSNDRATLGIKYQW